MNDNQDTVKVIGVFIVPARLPELIVVIEASDIQSLRLGEFWYFDPVSSSSWKLTNVAHSDPPSSTRETVELVQVSGNGKLVPGLELRMVPIGWQP